jgi:hypothetical protein
MVRQQGRADRDRRRRRAREADRPRHRHRGDGGRDPARRPRPLRRRERHPRQARPEDRRPSPVARRRGGREVDDYFKQVSLEDAQKLQPGAQIGDFIVDPLPPIEFGRIAAQAAKQVIFQKVRDAERERQYRGVQGPRGRDHHRRRQARRVRPRRRRPRPRRGRHPPRPADPARDGPRRRPRPLADHVDVRRETRGPQIFLSRAHPDFMKKLFAQEVPEIYDGIIEIKAVARDPGSRAKIGVISHDSSIDPVGACVGMKGSRVQAVVQELQGEKIDIIPWSRTSRPSSSTRCSRRRSAGRHRRGREPDRGGRARRPAQPRDRPPRPERAPRQPADRLGDRHPDRGRRQREAPARVRRALEMFQNELDVDETLPSCWSPKASAASRKSPTSSSTRSPRSRASTTISPPSFRAAPPRRSSAARPRRARSAGRSASPTSSPRCPI